MGWCEYSLYAGDGTQTLHINFITDAIPSITNDEIFDDDWFGKGNKTKIPKKYLDAFVKGVPNILKKIKAPRFWDEYSAIEWQMLLSLFIDNKLPTPDLVLKNGLEATEYLLDPASRHCEDFNVPSRRRAILKNFIKKVNSFNE